MRNHLGEPLAELGACDVLDVVDEDVDDGEVVLGLGDHPDVHLERSESLLRHQVVAGYRRKHEVQHLKVIVHGIRIASLYVKLS